MRNAQKFAAVAFNNKKKSRFDLCSRKFFNGRIMLIGQRREGELLGHKQPA
jgi:hypothetical protein